MIGFFIGVIVGIVISTLVAHRDAVAPVIAQWIEAFKAWRAKR